MKSGFPSPIYQVLLVKEIWFSAIAFLLATGLIFGQVQQATFEVVPEDFGENDTITILVSGIEPRQWGVEEIYLWAWSFDHYGQNPADAPGNGTWENSGSLHLLESIGNGQFRIELVPSLFFDRKGIGSIGFLVKARDGSGDKKTQDFVVTVGTFGLDLQFPETSRTILDSIRTITIRARTPDPVQFSLYANDSLIHITDEPDTLFQFEIKIERNTQFILQAHDDKDEQTVQFTVLIPPSVQYRDLPQNMKDGINHHPEDSSMHTFILYAPDKKWVHLIGSFNDWRITDDYVMHLDTLQDRFWFTLPEQKSNEDLLYQYLVDYEINIADPYSKLILDPHHDRFINSTVGLEIPDYPSTYTDQAVTWIPRNYTNYDWETDEFTPPARNQLVIYELLIRDFDQRHSFDALRERLDYLQVLGVNAIELMPIQEFDGNESWGYNPSFHSALDKYYGSPNALKRLVDECHRRGIAVILDVVFNHATGQNPYVRLWNDCNGCLEGRPTVDNPFFNRNPTHAYNVFHDFNHQSQATRDYVNQTIEHWIKEFRIDGFRWDLTKGFTQNCSGPNQERCTNEYQVDRVEVLKSYADLQWNLNPEFLVVFEHLGVGSSRIEEEEWARYRQDEGYGIILWNNQNYHYSEATMGYHSGGNSDFTEVYGANRELPVHSTLSYMESHDEERLMYKMLEYGNFSGDYQVRSSSTALNRLKLAAGFFFTVPGPKMIWQFGEVGYDFSINYNGRTGNKPIRWEYTIDRERQNVYKTFKALIRLRNSSSAFTSSESKVTMDVAGEIKQNAIEHEEIDATILGNFGVEQRNEKVKFTRPGKWYNYFSGDSLQIMDPDTSLIMAAGEFHIFTTKRFETPEMDILTPSVEFEDLMQTPALPQLKPGYPNPFTDRTQITYILPRASQITLDIYDPRGRKIDTILDHWQSAGEHTIEYIAPKLPAGLYFCRLRTPHHSVVQKIVRQ